MYIKFFIYNIIFLLVLNTVESFVFMKFNNDDVKLLKQIISYSLSTHDCVQFLHDGAEFPAQYYEVLYSSNIPIVNNETHVRCKAYIVLTKDVESLEIIIQKVKTWYSNRIVCFIYNDDPYLIDFLQNNVRFFGNAEVMVSNRVTTYKLDAVERLFYPVALTEKNLPWKKDEIITNFQGRNVTVATFNMSIFLNYGPLDDNGKPEWLDGVETLAFALIAGRINISWSVLAIDDVNRWGGQLPNGTWTGGLFKRLTEGRAEVGLGEVWLTPEKFMSTSLAIPYCEVSIRHLVWRPKPLTTQWDSLLRPFPRPIWGILATLTLLNTLLLTLITRCHYSFNKNFIYKEYANPWYSWYMTLGILLQSGVPRSHGEQGPLRHLLNGWVITCLLVTTCFSSSLVSHLTTPDLERRPETIPELVRDDYYWGLLYDPNQTLILDLSNPWHQKWSARFGIYKTIEEHIKQLDKDKFIIWGKSFEDRVFFLNEPYMPREKLVDREVSRETVVRFSLCFALSPGSQLLPPVNRYLRLLHESGIIKGIFSWVLLRTGEPYMKDVLVKTKSGRLEAEALTMANLSGVFYFLVVGWTIACLAFLSEIALYRCQQKNILYY